MVVIIYALLVSFIAGVVGTGAGGVLVSFIKSPDKNLPGLMMGFSGGIMLSIVLVDMFPEAAETGKLVPAISALAGAALLHILHDRIHKGESHASHKGKPSRDSMRATGIIMVAGIALHNLPEGLAIGSGLASEAGAATPSMDNYGMQLALLMLLHDIPEGVALAVPFSVSGTRPVGLIGMAALAGVPTVLGAGIGYLLGTISEVFIGACIAFAGGAMLYVTLRELLPDSVGLSGWRPGLFSILLGAFAGVGMVFVI